MNLQADMFSGEWSPPIGRRRYGKDIERRKKRMREWWAKNKAVQRERRKHRPGDKEKRVVAAKRRRLTNRGWLLSILTKVRQRARRKGIECTVTAKDLVFPEFCPVLGIPIFLTAGQFTDNSPSIDRIDPLRGYVPGNVSIISFRANSIKSYGSAEEHERIAAYMRGRG